MEWPSPRVSRENSVGKGEEEEEGGRGGEVALNSIIERGEKKKVAR